MLQNGEAYQLPERIVGRQLPHVGHPLEVYLISTYQGFKSHGMGLSQFSHGMGYAAIPPHPDT